MSRSKPIDDQDESKNKAIKLANQLYELVRTSNCTDDELLKAFAIAVGNCILVINKGDSNQAKVLINRLSSQIKETIILN